MSSATPRLVSASISSGSVQNPYETDRMLNEYLLFHYGTRHEVMPFSAGPVTALGFAERCVNECLNLEVLPSRARALDLGCAVGRSSFELAKHCNEVVGIDFSHRFIEAAESLRTFGELHYLRRDEGELCTQLVAKRPEGVRPERLQFEQGNAMSLRESLGDFDVVLMANLIDRLSSPELCLKRLESLVRRGGQLIITSPYTWMEEFTPKDNWLGGKMVENAPRGSLQGLVECLKPNFSLKSVFELPFLIREHSRKYQWSIAEASIWLKS